MKPRTKFEKYVMAADSKLPRYSQSTCEWASSILYHYAFRCPKGKALTCMDCGHTWQCDEKDGQYVSCPICGCMLKVRETRGRKAYDASYFNTACVHKGMQVIRIGRIDGHYMKGKKANYVIRDIGRYYISEEGKMALVGLKRTMGYYLDTFSSDDTMEIRNDSYTFQHISSFPVAPRAKYLDVLTDKLRYIPQLSGSLENGYKRVMKINVIHALLSSNHYETLFKSGREAHARFFMEDSKTLDYYWPAYKIAMRNNYKIADIDEWCGLIRLLNYYHLDTHNAHYVCPKDLKRAYSDLWERYRKNETEAAQRAAKVRRAKQAYEEEHREEIYAEAKGKYLDITFSESGLDFHVLQSVAEFEEEAKHMHHCVYSGGYFRKNESLILSATKGGKRVETVELRIMDGKVLQSFGACNQLTEYHDKIVEIVESHAYLFCKKSKAA